MLKPWTGKVVPSAEISSTVARAVATPSACVPDGAVLLTYTNAFHTRLRTLQFARLNTSCFLARVVTVCYGPGSDDGIGAWRVPAPTVPPSNYKKGGYMELIWYKWRLMHDALRVARVVLFVDSDVVLFRNPFDALGAAALGAAAFRYQSELACDAASCAAVPRRRGDRVAGSPPELCSINGGVLLATSESRPIVERVIAREPNFAAHWGNASYRMLLFDQDIADEEVRRGGAQSSCPLPVDRFVAFCWWAWGPKRGNRTHFDRLWPCRLATYHTNCLTTVGDKERSMQRMLQKTAHCGGDGKDRSRLGMWGPRASPAEAARAKGRGSPKRGRGTSARPRG